MIKFEPNFLLDTLRIKKIGKQTYNFKIIGLFPDQKYYEASFNTGPGRWTYQVEDFFQGCRLSLPELAFETYLEENDGNLFTLTEVKDRMDNETLKNSMINHPKHYNRGNIEAIDVIEDWKLNFALGSAIKYICRLGAKDDEIQELDKAIWYLKREKERRMKNK